MPSAIFFVHETGNLMQPETHATQCSGPALIKKVEEALLDTCLDSECWQSHLSHHREGNAFISFQ
jgi:hypothetical protein